MFGVYRTALALLVVAGHLGPLEHVGPYAVFAFYVLSGYLMTARGAATLEPCIQALPTRIRRAPTGTAS